MNRREALKAALALPLVWLVPAVPKKAQLGPLVLGPGNYFAKGPVCIAPGYRVVITGCHFDNMNGMYRVIESVPA